MIRRVRVGRRAQARIRAGGPTSTHRPALSRAAWQALRAYVFAREGWRCFVCRRKRPLDPHHLVKRSQGGSDSVSNVVSLCRPCHLATDRPMERGRLVVTALVDEKFSYRIITKRSGIGHSSVRYSWIP